MYVQVSPQGDVAGAGNRKLGVISNWVGAGLAEGGIILQGLFVCSRRFCRRARAQRARARRPAGQQGT